MNTKKYKKRIEEIKGDPGRGGCAILAIADLAAPASHELLRQALDGLIRMEHRGGSLGDTGDGAGLILRPERSFFERFIAHGRSLQSAKEPLIVGTVFFLHGERNIPQLTREMDLIIRREGLAPLGWRKTPVDPSALGARAREDAPIIFQLLAAKGHRREAQLFEALHHAKVLIERELAGIVNVVSLAPHTTVYKALAKSDQLASFYEDFRDPEFKTRVIVAHRRFSTNTFSNWNLVQPFRHIAHNGEINTITANCRAIKDADSALAIGNTLMNHGSDSAQLDRVAEMMVANGVTGIHEALRRMISPAWDEDLLGERERRFFEANRRALGTMGAWEGPIAILGTDGKILAAAMDRMGLRPLRYVRTKSDRVIVSSEAGAVPLEASEIECDGQLEPGAMLIADVENGEFISPESATAWIVDRTGLNFENLATVDLLPIGRGRQSEPLDIRALNAFGWTKERIEQLHEMIKGGKEPILGMGNDSPLAIFSENHSRLYSFLHQIVAVVTNPPIDPLREGGAIDTTVYLGRSPRISRRSDYMSWPQYKLDHPILTNDQMQAILSSDISELKAHEIDATFVDKGSPREIVRRIHDLTDEAVRVIRSKEASILVVTDYAATRGERPPVPMLLVVSSIHQALAARGLRRFASIIAETGSTHEGHDCAILLSYGATAVNPYAMLHLATTFSDIPPDEAYANVVKSVVHTLRRIMSKMGITTLTGYRGSALFEAIGISSDVVEYYIPDTVSRLGGITMDDIYEDTVARSAVGSNAIARNKNMTVYRKEVTDALQLVARNGNSNGDYDRFVKLLEDTPPVYLRDMLEFKKSDMPPHLEKVADTREIVRSTIRGAAMSHGALNSTAHRAIASAFNHFDAASCSGEGGEDERRNQDGEWASDRSRIRQIASGRFGVDATYLVHADEIEIKIGQGAKPGEGGHLPGRKVTEEIARIRKTKPGVDLISPPPHHDIYSIEDLAQLITNLRELHPEAIVSVKVPSVTNLGTIGVGVAKAGADVIVVSGFEGGTGAASSGSISHAGLPIERGVSELHQYLVVNGIRSRVRVRADGGIKCGMDAAKIIALGADEVSIGTPLLVAECCIFCRGCNKGNCPVGIATQDEEKQNKRFMRGYLKGVHPDEAAAMDRYNEAKSGVIRYLECMGDDLRNILATLGLTHPRELVGRVDLLKPRVSGMARWDRLDFTDMLMYFHGEARTARCVQTEFRAVSARNAEILSSARAVFDGRAGNAPIRISLCNGDHAVGATLAGEIARLRSDAPSPFPLPSRERVAETAERIEIHAKGYSGHGFGFAATDGMTLRLDGFANDGVAEAMSGNASVVIAPPAGVGGDCAPHLVGNSAAYGATGGRLYIAGRAGQRFGVRNSGALLICEGVGKYAFEYMTGGTGVVLGRCGPCVGSGMTGGEIYLFDPDGSARERLHSDVTAISLADEPGKTDALREILTDYYNDTKSPQARSLLDTWQETSTRFILVTPR